MKADADDSGVNSKLTVWYNTKCPVCDAGISSQRKLLIHAIETNAIEFRDINLEPDALSRFGAGVNDVRRRLHAVDSNGRLYAGIDCAIEIWRRTPGQAWLARIADLAVVRQMAGFGYDRFADVLYVWNRWKRHW